VKFVRKECVDRSQSSSLKSSGGITIVLILTEVQVEHRSRARCAQAEYSLRVCEPEKLLKDYCCRECAESKNFNSLK
jgi:hypothetical protein